MNNVLPCPRCGEARPSDETICQGMVEGEPCLQALSTPISSLSLEQLFAVDPEKFSLAAAEAPAWDEALACLLSGKLATWVAADRDKSEILSLANSFHPAVGQLLDGLDQMPLPLAGQALFPRSSWDLAKSAVN